MKFIFGVGTITREDEPVDYAQGATGEAEKIAYYNMFLTARGRKGAIIEFTDDQGKDYLRRCNEVWRTDRNARKRDWLKSSAPREG